ncbi:MAG: AAA family ATPase, partial [Cytophagales bacterium]|nr:AAA family ATPase [Cytophagales bacterium]
DDVEAAFKMIVDGGYTTTLFDSLTKNLENNRELYDFVSDIVINGKRTPFIITNQLINLSNLYGILTNVNGFCRVHNRIYEQRIYAHLVSNLLVANRTNLAPLPDYFTVEGLNVKLILQRFQAFMQENYSQQDMKFLEREGRLLFLAFLKPILNGRGFEFKEPTVADERRMDIVITYQ